MRKYNIYLIYFYFQRHERETIKHNGHLNDNTPPTWMLQIERDFNLHNRIMSDKFFTQDIETNIVL